MSSRRNSLKESAVASSAKKVAEMAEGGLASPAFSAQK